MCWYNHDGVLHKELCHIYIGTPPHVSLCNRAPIQHMLYLHILRRSVPQMLQGWSDLLLQLFLWGFFGPSEYIEKWTISIYHAGVRHTSDCTFLIQHDRKEHTNKAMEDPKFLQRSNARLVLRCSIRTRLLFTFSLFRHVAFTLCHVVLKDRT
jgi:hypothetical protein